MLASHPTVKLLRDGCEELKQPYPALAIGLITFLRAKRAYDGNSGGFGTASLSPGHIVDELWHWMLLNTAVAKAVHALIGGEVPHSTKRTVSDDELSVRRLTSLSFIARDGHEPQLQFWREPNTLLHDIAKTSVLVTGPDECNITVFAGRFSSHDDLRRIARFVWGYDDPSRLQPALPAFEDALASDPANPPAPAAGSSACADPLVRKRARADSDHAAAPAVASPNDYFHVKVRVQLTNDFFEFRVRPKTRVGSIMQVLLSYCGSGWQQYLMFDGEYMQWNEVIRMLSNGEPNSRVRPSVYVTALSGAIAPFRRLPSTATATTTVHDMGKCLRTAPAASSAHSVATGDTSRPGALRMSFGVETPVRVGRDANVSLATFRRGRASSATVVVTIRIVALQHAVFRVDIALSRRVRAVATGATCCKQQFAAPILYDDVPRTVMLFIRRGRAWRLRTPTGAHGHPRTSRTKLSSCCAAWQCSTAHSTHVSVRVCHATFRRRPILSTAAIDGKRDDNCP